jgi:hypothetical protein
MATLQEAIKKRRMKGLEDIESTLSGIQTNSRAGRNEEIMKMVIDTKLEAVKDDIMKELENYVGDVTEMLMKNRLKGDVGEMGPMGKQGPKGATGPRGERGPAGRDGMNGRDGVNGEKGKDGKSGKDGMNGVNGMDGVSVSVESVMEAIQPEIEKMMMEVKQAVRAMKPAKGGGGGGGMGNPTTFSFSGDDSTVAFTLGANVAANGLACWAYLNGQWIQPGVHFNISGKTLTTTFTPATGDTLEGFFIRT